MLGEQVKAKAFSEDDAVVIRRVLMVGATENGEHVGVEIETEDKRNQVVLIPFSLFQRFMLSLMTAGGIAHREQVARFGSNSAALNAGGFSAFKPSSYDVGRLRLADGEDLVLLRLKQGSLPIIDVRIPVELASPLAQDIGMEAAATAPARQPRH